MNNLLKKLLFFLLFTIFNYYLGLGCNEFGDYCDGSENQVGVEPGEENQVGVEPGKENQVGFEPTVENKPGSRFRRSIPNSHLAKGNTLHYRNNNNMNMLQHKVVFFLCVISQLSDFKYIDSTQEIKI